MYGQVNRRNDVELPLTQTVQPSLHFTLYFTDIASPIKYHTPESRSLYHIVHTHGRRYPVLPDKIDPHTIDKSSRRGKKKVWIRRRQRRVVAQSPHTQQAAPLTDCNFVQQQPPNNDEIFTDPEFGLVAAELSHSSISSVRLVNS